MRVSALAILVAVFVGTSCAHRTTAVAGGADAIRGAAPVYRLGTPGLVLPKVVRTAPPAYTPEAMQAKVMGQVDLLVRIGADGRPERARVVKSLDKVHGLDEQAMFALGRSLFEPATLDGKAVAVEDMPISMSFRIY